MNENPKHVTVRLRVLPELRDKIARSAKEHNRSMNADMVARLEDSFDRITLPFDSSMEELEKYFLSVKKDRELNKQMMEMMKNLYEQLMEFKGNLEVATKKAEGKKNTQ